jgi:pimeloyl-ACP methyl ester carboxylesterase
MPHFTTSDGLSIAWYELGTGADEPPILLQHGYSATTSSEWLECGIAASLASLGRRVIGVDALGHGGSDHPHDPALYGERRMARDIIELTQSLGITAYDLVGYSMGAVVAAIAGSADTRIRRLVLGGVGEAVHLLGGVDTRELDNLAMAAALEAESEAALAPGWLWLRQFAARLGNDRLALAAQARSINATPIALDQITATTMVLAGDADPLAIRPEALAAAIPGASLTLVPGDHTSARLGPAFTAALLHFLA